MTGMSREAGGSGPGGLGTDVPAVAAPAVAADDDVAPATPTVTDLFREHHLERRSQHRRAAVARKYAPRLALPPDVASPDAASAIGDRGELAAALRLLPRRQREVLVLRYYADLSVAEIAETLRIAPSAVRACNSRGLSALAHALRGDKS